MCVSMLDSHRACISYCVNAGLPQSLNIFLCECVFPCWTPTELVFPRVNVCFHAGLPQNLSVIRLHEKIGFELVGILKVSRDDASFARSGRLLHSVFLR